METLGHRLLDLTVGCADDTCTVPDEPVAFGQRYWLAQHRWIEPLVGLVALVAVGGLYVLSFQVLTTAAAWALMAVWGAFVVGGLVLRVVRPCTVLRLPVHALLLWVLVLASSGATGLAA